MFIYSKRPFGTAKLYVIFILFRNLISAFHDLAVKVVTKLSALQILTPTIELSILSPIDQIYYSYVKIDLRFVFFVCIRAGMDLVLELEWEQG